MGTLLPPCLQAVRLELRTLIAKANQCSVYDTFPPTFSSENFLKFKKSLQECYSQHSYTHTTLDSNNWCFSGFIIYLSSHQTITFLSISKLQMLWYYFFNILYKYFQIYRRVNTHLESSVHFSVFACFSVHLSVHHSVNPSYCSIVITSITGCHSWFPSHKGQLLKSCLYVFKTSLPYLHLFQPKKCSAIYVLWAFSLLNFLWSIKTQTLLGEGIFSLLQKKRKKERKDTETLRLL